MGNTDRRGPEISDGWQGTSEDGSNVDTSSGGPLKVAVIGAGVAGLGVYTCVYAIFLRATYQIIHVVENFVSLICLYRGDGVLGF